MPAGTSVLGAGYAKTTGDIAFDPLLLIEDGSADIDTLVLSIRVFRPGLWASVSAAYGWGGENTVDAVAKDDSRRDVLAAVSVGFPIARNQGIKFAYIANRKHVDTGADLDTLAISWSRLF